GYDDKSAGYFVREKHTAPDVEKAREQALSFAAYDVLTDRYEHAIGGARTAACLRAVMTDLGYDADDKHDQGDDPVAFGHRIGHAIALFGKNDGANEDSDYDDPSLPPSVNPPLVYDAPGTTLLAPEIWQPINLSVAATQNGIVLPAGVQHYIGAGWGKVTPFAIKRASATAPFFDPGPTPKPTSPDMKKWVALVIQKTAEVDMTSDATVDASPGAYGHNALGANDGHGWEKNPVTVQPYDPRVMPLGDFARVMAEFWADGPKSETPPGHWNTIANAVADSPAFERKLFGAGEPLDALAWDVHVYFALNAAEHDAAIAAWGTKRLTMTSRPISLIRWMGGKGQSSDPKLPSYDRDGLPLLPGLIELVTAESSAPGQRHEKLARFVGQVAVRDWLGEPADRQNQISGVGWVRAVDWIPFQRRTFVTPAFPAFISGHSTFSRAGAETLTAITGSQFFPGGYGELVAPKDTFLQIEEGPSIEVHLGWASYFDASDEAGQSRIYGGVDMQPDDFAGRRVGHQVGLAATALAKKYFDGTIATKK
ncbi:MAG: vanadium-dependent haloperoxidase, partial [Polyangiaceae bacterium]